jgi:Na+-translocating ferredoxin:NAD+ oxidoreductase subunit D
MATDHSLFTVGAGPHWRTKTSLPKMNYAFLFALVPTALAGCVAHGFGPKAAELGATYETVNPLVRILTLEMGVNAGPLWMIGALGTIALAVGAAILAEYAAQIAMRQPYRANDGHAALMGLLMGLLMPPSAPWWFVVIGVAVAIWLGKAIFGGLGGYPMHPAAIGWLILLVSWPAYIYPVENGSIAAAHPAVVAVTALSGIALWLTGYIRWEVPVAVFVGTLVTSLALWGPLDGQIAEQFTSGHVVLLAIFMATDSTCSPANRRAMWAYGLSIGFFVVLIRAFGIWPDAAPFALVLVNVMHPLLDRLRPPVRKVVA